MVTVAVAGGTGGVGRTIVEELVRQSRHQVLILSRKTSNIPEIETVPILEADYTSRVALKELLRNHGVQVIISALSLYDDENASAQMTLINAAIESGTVKRFLPSEFGVDYSCPGVVESYPGAKWFNDAADALRKFELEFTRVVFGQLSDFYGFPHYKSCMKQFTYFLDFKSKKAALPGDGEATATFLHSVDIAKYTAALLNEEKWPETSAFASDRMSWIDLVKMAERVMNEKWDITYDTLEKL